MTTSTNLKGKILQNETISTINLFTGAKIKSNEKGEVNDVCLAIEEIKQEAVAKEFVNSIDNMVINLDISVERACSILKRTVQDYENAKKFINDAEEAYQKAKAEVESKKLSKNVTTA